MSYAGRACAGRASGWYGLLAGVLGGAAAGTADVLLALARGLGLASSGRGIWLLLVGAGLGGFAGLAVAAVFRGAQALPGRRGRSRHVPVAVLLGAPVVLYDAFAMFSGARASRIPGRTLIATALAALGLGALALAGHCYLRILVRREAGAPPRTAAGAAVTLLGCAAGLHFANREILPRLYPWFHASLSLLYLLCCVLAARLALSIAGSPPAARAGRHRRATLIAVALAAACLFVAMPAVARSQTLRFAAHERTQVVGLLIRSLQLPRPPRALPGSATADLGAGDLPLPEGPRLPQADVFLVTIDALRADHIGAYGYQRHTTPNFDAFAARSVRFERAYAQAPHTSFSVASMLTGKYYPTIARLAPGDAHDSIAGILRRYGWKTAAFYPPAVFFVDAHKLKAFQESHFGFEYVKFEYLDAERRLDQIAEFFRSEQPRRAFVWLHLFEPHEPYEAREGFGFGTRDVDRYDSEVAYSDAVLGRLLDFIDEERPGAVVVVSADHGEEFDEHGGRYHGSSLYDEQVRVPLVIHVPGVEPGVVGGQVELVDISPTILGLLDIPVPVRMRGNDLGPWLARPPAPAHRLPPAFAELEDKRMLVWGMEKLICDLNWSYCALYDLGADPGEQRSLAEERPQRTAALRSRLDQWLEGHVRYEPELARGPANPAGGVVPKAIERGRLGDMGVIGDLAAMITSPEPAATRLEAARLLVSLPPHKETSEVVIAALGRVTEPALRDWTAVAAARLGDARARDHLRAVLARPPAAGGERDDRDLRIHASLALARAGDATGLSVLASALDACEDNVLLCRRIVIHLGDLGDARAAPVLLAHVGEVQNRREMVEALGKIGDPAVAMALVYRLKRDEYVPVRAEAARALARIGGSVAEAGLRWSVEREPESPVRAAASAGLDALARKARAERLRSQPAPASYPDGARVEASSHPR